LRVLVAEDDRELASRVREVLQQSGFACDLAHDGEEADFLARTESYDTVVLDLGLPRRDGLSVLGAWREDRLDFPVLILTARGRWSEKRAGFHAGADDYLTKPFELGEVVLRVQALIRRAAGRASPELRCGELVLDTRSNAVRLAEQPVSLTNQEFRILAYMLHHPGKVISRSEFIEHVYERDLDPDSNVLDVLIGRLRRKLGSGLIETVRGQGFRLVDADR